MMSLTLNIILRGFALRHSWCKKGERESVLLGEPCVGLLAVLAYTDNVVSCGFQGLVVVPDGTGLGSTPGGVVLRVEIDDGLLSDEIGGFHSVAALVLDLE